MNFDWFAFTFRRKKSKGRSRVDGLLTPAPGSKSATPDNRQLLRDESRSTINDHYNYAERAATLFLSLSLSSLVNAVRGIIKQICAGVSDLTSAGAALRRSRGQICPVLSARLRPVARRIVEIISSTWFPEYMPAAWTNESSFLPAAESNNR